MGVSRFAFPEKSLDHVDGSVVLHSSSGGKWIPVCMHVAANPAQQLSLGGAEVQYHCTLRTSVPSSLSFTSRPLSASATTNLFQ